MAEQFTDSQGDVFVSSECPTCGMRSFFPRTLQRQAFVIRDRNDKDSDGKPRQLDLYCPKGHAWAYYSADELAKTKKEPEPDPETEKNRLIDVLMGRAEKKEGEP